MVVIRELGVIRIRCNTGAISDLGMVVGPLKAYAVLMKTMNAVPLQRDASPRALALALAPARCHCVCDHRFRISDHHHYEGLTALSTMGPTRTFSLSEAQVQWALPTPSC